MKHSQTTPWWTAVSRTVLLNRGAQANAAEELGRARRTRVERAEAAVALSQAQQGVDVGRQRQARAAR